jgi:hypothetical protein
MEERLALVDIPGIAQCYLVGAAYILNYRVSRQTVAARNHHLLTRIPGNRGVVSFLNSGQKVRESHAAHVDSSDAFLSQVDTILSSTSSLPRQTSIFATTSSNIEAALSMLA